jgi:hypothetical protein
MNGRPTSPFEISGLFFRAREGCECAIKAYNQSIDREGVGEAGRLAGCRLAGSKVVSVLVISTPLVRDNLVNTSSFVPSTTISADLMKLGSWILLVIFIRTNITLIPKSCISSANI